MSPAARRLSVYAFLLMVSLGWQAGGGVSRAFGQTALPNVTITTNQSAYSSGDRMVVTVMHVTVAGFIG